MKGINLFCLYPERRVEAHELAKAALKADMQSHMCWHVFGILHKSDRDYQQAAKCYLNALKWDPENLNLFRDLSNIQMQIRDVKGLVETASKMLSLRSTNRANWMLLAVAHHMDKNHSTAADVRPPSPHFSHSEHHTIACCNIMYTQAKQDIYSEYTEF